MKNETRWKVREKNSRKLFIKRDRSCRHSSRQNRRSC